MRKREEIDRPDSCLNKAADDEPVFVLLARDMAAVHAVTRWVNARQELGLNSPQDEKLFDALDWCVLAIKWREANGR